MNQHLTAWAVPLEPVAARRWQDEYGITGVYLNDIAAGAIIEVPLDWAPDEAVNHVATGLRHLLQDLWHLDLVRPLLAVYFPSEGSETVRHLRRLTWDDEWHRGDFALRASRDREDAEDLLYTLMGDTMGALDASARSDRVGVAEVRSALEQRHEELREVETDAVMSLRRPSWRSERVLVGAILEAVDRADAGGSAPDLVPVLEAWVESKGGAP